MPHVKAGTARMLAVTMAERSAILPDVPPISDTVPGFDLSAWTGLFAPGNTPKEVVQAVYDALQKSLNDPQLQAKFKSIGFDPQPMGPDEFTPYISKEIDKWRTVVRETGIELQ